MRDVIACPTYAMAIVVSKALVASLTTVSTASAQEGVCETSRVIIEGGNPSPFILPDNAWDTLTVDARAILLVRGENLPPNASLRWSLSGIGVSLDRDVEALGTYPVTIDLADYTDHVRGLFQL